MKIIQQGSLPDFTRTLKILIFLLSLIFVIASQDPNLGDQTIQTIILHNLLLKNFIHQHFSVFMFVILLISIIIFFRYDISFGRKKGREKTLIIATFIYTFLLLINPNNDTLNPILGLPLLSDPSLYVGLIFMYVLFFTNTSVSLHFIALFTAFFLKISVANALFLFGKYMLGFGNTFLGSSTVLMEEDTLILLVLVQILLLALFFITGKKSYLFLSVFLILFQFLSFRRSSVLLTVLTNTTYILAYNWRYGNIHKTLIFFILSLGLLSIISINLNNLPEPVIKYMNRYLGQFVDLPKSHKYAAEAKNEHIEQSNYGFAYALDNLEFWGTGFGKRIEKERFNFKGNTGIHNAYYDLWEIQGLYALLYYVLIIVLFLKEALRTIFNRKRLSKEVFLLKLGVIVFFFFFLVNAWVLMMVNLTGIKMVLARTLVLVFLFNVDNTNVKIFFPKTVAKE